VNSESNGQHTIFIIILILILSLSYSLTPLHESDKTMHKISKKAQTKVISHETDKTGSKKQIAHVKKDDKSPADKVKAPSEEVLTKTEITKPETAKVKEQKNETQKGATPTASEGKNGLTDIILMNNPAYKKHTKGIVSFTHKNHVETHAIACGACHHDETGKPLELTVNDTVQGCIACHVETEKPKGEKLEKKEQIAKYHFEAMHANCVGCHKDYNREKGGDKAKGPAPSSCTNCHPK